MNTPPIFRVIVFARSQRAAERLLGSCQKYLEGKLKLKMNMDKSAATSVFSSKFKFLGFALGKSGQGIHIRAHKKSLKKAKEKLKEKTKRSQPKTARAVMKDVEKYIRGWIGYYHIASIKTTLNNWNEWLKRRIRMYIWKQ